MRGYKLDNKEKELKNHQMLTSISFICFWLALQIFVFNTL